MLKHRWQKFPLKLALELALDLASGESFRQALLH
jgi:hypothetical protein